MKIGWNRKYTTIAVYVCLVILFSIVCISFFFNSSFFANILSTVINALTPILIAIAIAFILNPLMVFIEKNILKFKDSSRGKRKLKRGLAVTLTYLFFVAAVVAFVWIIVPRVWDGISDFINNFSSYVNDFSDWVNSLAEKFPALSEPLQTVVESLRNLSKHFSGIAETIMDKLPEIVDFLSGFVSAISDFVVAFVMSIYLLASKEQLQAQIKKISRAVFTEKRHTKLSLIASTGKQIFSKYITTAIIDSVFIGIVCFILMTVFRLPYASVISLVIGVTNMIPFFGPFIGAIPSAVVLFIIRPYYAFIFVALILVIQQIDGNIVVPRLQGSATGIGATWACIAVALMSGLFGILGMFIGVPIFAIVYYIVKITVEDRLQKKKLPYETKDYYSSLQEFEYLGPSGVLNDRAKRKQRKKGVPEVNIEAPKEEKSDGDENKE